MTAPLALKFSTADEPALSGDQILDRFLAYAADAKLELYPAQEEAILELYSGKNVILNTPTGSGKSLVAAALHFESLARGRRSFYTSPIKALVNEKFLSLCHDFGAEQVGMITGDASVNPSARIICCTAEILANDALRHGADAPVDDIVMDEFHFFSDRERGVAWQIPLLTLPRARFLLMSATLGDTEPFEKHLTAFTGRETPVVRSMHRPVPLEYRYSENALHETVPQLIRDGRAPVYIVHFTQASCAETAQDFLSVDFCSKEEKTTIAKALEGVKFPSPYGKELTRMLRHGIGLHHAGLLPRYRILVERLARQGLLKLICGTDTLGVGVNVPIKTVLFTQLCKFSGERTALLTVRDFQQIAGRAGRKGYDTLGTIVAQAPEHVIENLRNEQKASGDAKKLKKLVKKKPPEKGYVAWDKAIFERLSTGQPEALISRFQVTHGMLLNVLSRPDGGCDAMRSLIRASFETNVAKLRHRKHAFQLFRSLHERGIIEFAERVDGPGKRIRLNIDLQQDFSLNQALSLYLVDTVKLLDPTLTSYALDLLTLVESILENPELILRKQLDRVKTEKMGELKAQGMDFDQRIEELEKLEYPKPNREFIYDTFNQFAANHPWVGQENIRPKSIAREMYEMFMSFDEYIREYSLQRAEGLLLRYISEVYKTLLQTVPEADQNNEIREMTTYFRSMVREVDSSLIDEWEKIRNPSWNPESGVVAERPYDLTQDKRAFMAAIRNEIFLFIRALATGDWVRAAAWGSAGATPPAESGDTLTAGSGPWTADRIEGRMRAYFEGHPRLRTDTPARAPKNSQIKPEDGGATWSIHQVLVDSAEANDWMIEFSLDLGLSREEQRPVLKLIDIREA